MGLEAYVHSSTDLAVITCGACGGIYAISERYRSFKHERGGFWHCPYCEVSWGYGKSKIDDLNKQLADKQREVEQERKRKEWA
jgi:hypothetical protein